MALEAKFESTVKSINKKVSQELGKKKKDGKKSDHTEKGRDNKSKDHPKKWPAPKPEEKKKNSSKGTCGIGMVRVLRVNVRS